jgi:hypothetical protein
LIAADALAELMRVLEELVPAEADAALQPRLTLSGLRLAPSGVGGYVGTSIDPPGDIQAQRLAASVTITLRATDAEGLSLAVHHMTEALLGANRADLRRRGILRCGLDQVGEVSLVGEGSNQRAQRDVDFSLLYEFLQGPAAAGEGIIELIPLEVEMGGPNTRVLFASQFTSDPLSLFEVVDDPAATTGAPSNWAYNPAEQRIEQRAAIRGASTAPSANKPGTALVLRSSPMRPPVQDFAVHAEMSSADDRGMGLVFRWLDVDNFGFFVMNQRNHFRLLGKKVDGAFALLETPAVDSAAGFEVSRLNDVKLVGRDSALQVFLNDQLILEGEDASLVRAGRIGLFCQGNNQAQFSMLRLTRL